MTTLIGLCRLYGCTCGQVMYYLTHYFASEIGDRAYIKTTVRRAVFGLSMDTNIFANSACRLS